MKKHAYAQTIATTTGGTPIRPQSYWPTAVHRFLFGVGAAIVIIVIVVTYGLDLWGRCVRHDVRPIKTKMDLGELLTVMQTT